MGKENCQIGGSWLCYVRNTASFKHPIETSPSQMCRQKKRLLSQFRNQTTAAPQRQQAAVNFLMEGGKFAFEREPTHSQTLRDFL